MPDIILPEMRYRVFTNDIGPSQYSAFCDVEASHHRYALNKAIDKCEHLANFHGRLLKILAIPYSSRDLWPDGETGRVDENAVRKFKAIVAE